MRNNEGNFLELLRFRIDAGDTKLEEHLKNTSSKATYISKTVQNELIECCGQEVLSVIINRVYKAKFYSIMFDETTDLSHTSQMSVVLRYVYENKIYEDFVGFLNCHHENYEKININECENFEPMLTGKILGITVIKLLKSLELDLKLCVGIGTDGCEVMVSEQVGAIQEIKKSTLVAERCACYNHAFKYFQVIAS